MLKKTILCIMVLMLSGCSVYKASSHSGVYETSIMACKERNCLLSRHMALIHQFDKNGKHIEVYRALSPQSNGGFIRAIVYAVLDVYTVFLWEIIGTSVENEIVKDQKYLVVQATFKNKSSHDIEVLELYKGH